MAAGLLRFLNPQTVAVVGGAEAAQVIVQCRKMGYRGEIWPVNPRRETLEGLACRKSPDDLPAAPDAAFVAVPAEATVGVVAALEAMGAGGAVCYAAGFAETGAEGAALQRRLGEAAGSMPVLGPNCYGYLNFLSGVALWPDQFGYVRQTGGVAIITQSGNLGINITMQRRGLPVAWMITLGNQAQTSAEDCLEAAAECADITAIGMHLEEVRDPGRFAHAAAKAIGHGKPVVVVKAGRSEAGARIALGHTASMASEGTLYDALFARLGVSCVRDIDTFIEALKLAAVVGEVEGNRVASVSCSGGEASLMADLCEHTGLEFPKPGRRAHDAVAAALGGRVRVDNPLDFHTFIWGDGERMAECFSGMLGDDFDFTFFVSDHPRADQCDTRAWEVQLDAIARSVRSTGGRAGVVATLGENMPEEVARHLMGAGVVPFCGMHQALAAVEASWRARSARTDAPMPEFGAGAAGPSETLDEHAGKRLLEEGGIAVPRGCVAQSVGECLAVARELGYPVAAKGMPDGLVHKTEAGAVALGLAGEQELEEHAGRLLAQHGRVLVERMVTGAVAELLVGVDRDGHLGDYLVVGAGGIFAELLNDREVLLLPATADAVLRALSRLRLAPLLGGFRGRPQADADAAVAAVMAMAGHPGRGDGHVLSMEVNPLLVMPKSRAGGPGAIAADAVVQVRKSRAN